MSETVIQAIELFFQEDTSDKVYNVTLVEVSGAYTVRVEWGRRGARLQQGAKAVDVDLPRARRAYDKVVKQKTSKGYEEWTAQNQPAAVAPAAGQGSASRAGIQSRPRVGPRAQLLNPVDALDALLDDDAWIAQQKLDGMRVILILSDGDLIAVNREGQATSFPKEIASALEDAGDAVVDGELMADGVYWLFDLLFDGAEDLRPLSYDDRYARLEDLELFCDEVRLVSTARGAADKRALLARLEDQSAEGVVFKRAAAPYTEGRPASGGDQQKHKLLKSADVIITANAGNAYQMAVNDNGALVEVGKVFAGTTNESRAELDDLLRDGETPVAEVRYLYATKDDVLYQPVFVRVRDDKDDVDCTLDQLVHTDRSVSG